MDQERTWPGISAAGTLLGRLARDRAGNTIALVAASVAPLLALVGGGIDMSRSYLSQSRLQQACDAGVLAARKKLGSAVVLDGNVPDDAIQVGDRFFNLNFRDGAYGSEDRKFSMSLEEDYAVSGEADVNVPTTIMRIFGNDNMPIHVECQAQLNFANTDIMFVLDTTGSMNETNPGDSTSKINALRQVVKNFVQQLDDSKGPGVRIRYGFVPYSVNANVGALLEDDWVVDEWTYQSREKVVDPLNVTPYTYYDNWNTISGDYADSVVSTYDATYHDSSGGFTDSKSGGGGYYSCDGTLPTSTYSNSDTLLSTATEPYVGPPAGTKTTEHYSRVSNGNSYWNTLSGTTCTVHQRAHNALTQEFDKITLPQNKSTWVYKPVTRDVSNWRSETIGCMEERSTYEIYSKDEAVDLSRALDLDLDTVPTPGNPDTQWRPMYPNIIWERELKNGNSNNFKVEPSTYEGNYFHPADSSSLVSCPSPARKLAEMTPAEVGAYVDSLAVGGYTYHDIGMIWGGRLISPTGLFAAENADVSGKKTTRHLIFLTDGQTQPMDIAYGAYGVEPLDQRRWTDRPDPLLDRTIEIRFLLACNEVKKKNVTVWVIGFGTKMNDVITECAGDGHWFQADDSKQLSDAFDKIAKSMGDLRVSR